MSCAALLHVMDAMLPKDNRGLDPLLRRQNLQVSVEYLQGDQEWALSSVQTSGNRKAASVVFDSKLRLELPRLTSLVGIEDGKHSLRLGIFYDREEEGDGAKREKIVIAEATVPLSTLIKVGVAAEGRKEHIFKLMNALGGEDCIARLRVGLLFVSGNESSGPTKDFFESSTAAARRSITRFFGKSAAEISTTTIPTTSATSATSPAADKDDEATAGAETNSSKAAYAKRVAAGNAVLNDLKLLAERLDLRDPDKKEDFLLVPATTLIEFLRARVSRESAELVNAIRQNNGVPGPLDPPDVTTLFRVGLCKSRLPAFQFAFSSVSVFVARRLKISTGATAVAEASEISSMIGSVEHEIKSIAKETTDLHLFFAKSQASGSGNKENDNPDDIPLASIESDEAFHLACERRLSELSSCVDEEWGPAGKPRTTTASNDVNNAKLSRFFSDKAKVIGEAVEVKIDACLAQIERENDLAYKLRVASSKSRESLERLRSFRKRIKDLQSRLRNLSTAQKGGHQNAGGDWSIEDHEEQPPQPPKGLFDSTTKSEQQLLFELVVSCFEQCIRNRSLVAFQRSLRKVMFDGPPRALSAAEVLPASPKKDVSALLRVAAVLAESLSLIPLVAESMAHPLDLDAQHSAAAKDLIAVAVKAVAAALEHGKDAPLSMRSFFEALQHLVPIKTESPEAEAVSAPKEAASEERQPTAKAPTMASRADLIAAASELADRHFKGKPADDLALSRWLGHERDAFILLLLLLQAPPSPEHVLDLFSALAQGGDGPLLIFTSYVKASAEQRNALSCLEIADSLSSLLCLSAPPLIREGDAQSAERETAILTRAMLLVRRCRMSKGKVIPSEKQICVALDSDPILEGTHDIISQKNLLHLAIEGGAEPILVTALLARGKVNPRQLDLFQRSPAQYCGGKRPDLLRLFMHLGSEAPPAFGEAASSVLITKKKETKRKGMQ